MSTNTIPSISGDINHLAAFKPSKYTINDVINNDRLTLTDVEDDSDDDDSDNRMPTEVFVGDIILFFDGQHHGRMENLSYSQIVSIKTFVNDDEDSDAEIGLSTNANFHIHHNRVVVYRLDGSGVLRDVTYNRFMWMENLQLIDGTIEAGTYVTDTDRFTTIMNRNQRRYNERLVATGEIRSVEDGVDLGLNITNGNPTAVIDDEVLSTMMNKVIAQFKLRQKEYTQLTDYLRDKKEKMKALEEAREKEKRHQPTMSKDYTSDESISGIELSKMSSVDNRKQPPESLQDVEVIDMYKDSSDDEVAHEVDNDKNDKIDEKMPASVQEQSLTSSSSSEGRDMMNSNGIMYANLPTSDIQDLIDEEVLGFSKTWKGKIPFHLRVVNYGVDVASIHEQPLQLLDICDFLDGQDIMCKRLYFSFEKYPPPTNDIEMKADEFGNTNCAGFSSLKLDLQVAAENSGSPIVMNGGGNDKGTEQQRRARCAHCYRRKRKSRAQPITADNPHKKTTLVHDRRNNRGPKGISLSKRVKQTKKDVVCKLQYLIKDAHVAVDDISNAVDDGYIVEEI